LNASAPVTILVIEDNPQVLSVVERFLSAAGHVVLTAHDAAEADFALEDHAGAPDVLLADIILAADTGIDYARTLKRRFPALKVVFMTGLAHRAPAALRSGLGPVLHKPFSKEDLLRMISAA
jgi:CheY-like chemotaxis protein